MPVKNLGTLAKRNLTMNAADICNEWASDFKIAGLMGDYKLWTALSQFFNGPKTAEDIAVLNEKSMLKYAIEHCINSTTSSNTAIREEALFLKGEFEKYL